MQWLTQTKGVAPEDVAIMFRSNHNQAWSGPLSERLQLYGVPVVNTGEVPEVLSEPSNRRLLALARLVVDKNDSLAWWTMLHLTRGIGPAVRDHFYDAAVGANHRFVDQLLQEHGSAARSGDTFGHAA